MDFAIDQQQFLQGYLPIVFLDLRQAVRPDARVAAEPILTGPGFVTKDNVDPVIGLSARHDPLGERSERRASGRLHDGRPRADPVHRRGRPYDHGHRA